MRLMIKQVMVLVLVATMALVSIACFGGNNKPPTKEEFIADAREVISGLRDAVPILNSAGVSTVNLQKGINTGDHLVTAFENSDSRNALLLTADLIDAFEASEVDAQLIKDGVTRTIVMTGLALAKIALRRLASRVDNAVALAESPRAKTFGVRVPGVTSFQDSQQKSKAQEAKQKIKALLKKKQSRCKNAKTGRFEKMEFCKAYPELSYIVTF